MKNHRGVETAFALVLATLAAMPVPARAGRPLSTEDASVLAAKACQVEAWVDRYREAARGVASRMEQSLPHRALSFSSGDNAPVLHLNVGASHDRAERRTVTLWGAGVELPVAPRATLVAEAFGENAATPFVRAGLRFSAIADRLDLDLTVVTKPGGTREERYVSLGLTWVTP